MLQTVPPTRVVNIRMETYEVYIGRPSLFGNPFSFRKSKLAKEIVKKPEDAIDKYREWFYNKIKGDEKFRKEVEKLRGKTLGCFCKSAKGFQGQVLCHGQVIAAFLDGLSPEEVQ